MVIDNLVNVQGPLAKALPKLDLSTVQHAFEIMNARRADKSLRDLWFWTADFAMYAVEDKEEYLYFASRDYNLVFQNLDDAVKQLLETGNYVPENQGVDVVKAGKDTLKIKLSDLKLERRNSEFSYFEVDTVKY